MIYAIDISWEVILGGKPPNPLGSLRSDIFLEKVIGMVKIEILAS